MNFTVMLGLLLLGCSLGYIHYEWGKKRDAERRSKLNEEKAGWDWYQVKLRLPYMYIEDNRGSVVVEVKAKDRDHAQEEARKLLKMRSMANCEWITVIRK